ncbi:hypothetical protein PIB30_048110 [Stylosanthes scabra]|nr:hypothetical protein [Stylosanthes scabra]
MTSYPDVFVESSFLDSKGRPRPGFGLTPQALKLYHKQAEILEKNQLELRDRLCRLLMLTRTKDRILPLETIDQLQWDLGLPYDYLNCFVPNHPDRFSLVRLPDGRDGLKLLFWDDKLAVSELMKNASLQQDKEDIKNDGSLAFPVSGFGMKKCMEWLEEWQKLPYTSPYTNASNSDRHTNEKRVVGILHELLHLTLHKQTEVENLSNLCKPFMLHQNLTKVFERHLGIFYLSYNYYEKPTVVLREGYNGRELKQKHPLVRIRQKLANLLKERLDNDENLYNSEEFGYDSDGFPIDIDKLF